MIKIRKKQIKKLWNKKKGLFKFLLFFGVVQILIILDLQISISTAVNNPDELEQKTIVVENTYYKSGGRIAVPVFYVYADNNRYDFYAESGSKPHELNEMINVGDKITLQYAEESKFPFLNKKNLVYGAYSENKVYRSTTKSIDSYGFNAFAVTYYIFIEFIFLLVFIPFLIFFILELDSFNILKRTKRKKN